jgi:hypothetical protein
MENFYDDHIGEEIEDYINKNYKARVPEPPTPTAEDLSFRKIVGIESLLFTSSGLGAVVFSAIRTGGYFYIVERQLLSKFNIPGIIIEILSWMALVSTLFAFEGLLLATGFAKGKNQSNTKVSNIGIVSAFVAIVVIGILSGLGIVKMQTNIESGLNLLAALITSISAAIISFFGGENIGYTFSLYDTKKADLLREHEDRYRMWREGAVRSFNITRSKFQKNSKNERNFSNDEVEFQKAFQSMSKIDQARYLVKKHYDTTGEMAVNSDISKQGISIGYASQAINEFIQQNGEELVHSGKISEERYARVKLNSA